MNAHKFIIGIDVGGTKISAVLMDPRSRKIVDRKRISTPSDYAGLLMLINQLVHKFEESYGTALVGVGHPGSSRLISGLVHNANIRWLNNQAFQKDLCKLLKRDVATANDANCFVLSEAIDGVAAGAKVVFGITLGTGLGGGLVLNGKIHEGRHGLAGEFGHTALPWPEAVEVPGPLCYCGLNGCLETFLSGPGLVRTYQYLKTENISISSEEVVKYALAGDGMAQKALTIFENRLARALASVINFLDPDVIVLGGGLSELDRLYTNIPRLWQAYTFSLAPVKTPLLKAKYGGDSGVRGAAFLKGDFYDRYRLK